MTAPDQPLVREHAPLPEPAEDEVRVRIAGCGVCHTDLGFLFGGVRTRQPPPLTLGHEIAGEVEACGAGARSWAGKAVVVPAVLPCGECALCRSGRETSCPTQRMPGNDFHGGFASHLIVPARWLVDAEGIPSELGLADVSVLADAITTPYEAMVRAEVGAGDAVVVIGVGGVGNFGVQIARARGARILAVDVDEQRLDGARRVGAEATVCTAGLDGKQARTAVKTALSQAEFPAVGLKVLEMSGTPAGQTLAWSLLTSSGVLGIVGFCLEAVPIRLSKLMALDARAFGNWGCRPQHYPEAMELIRSGEIAVKPFVRPFPMDEINEVLVAVREHRIKERPVLIP